MRAIILAGGRATRWNGRAKHLLKVDGETLLDRMVRLLRERGVTDIVMAGPYDLGIPRVRTRDDGIDGRIAVMPYADPTGRTVLLMGDVWYSAAAMDAICSDGPEPRLFARFTGSETTGKKYGEIWANSFLPEHYLEVHRLLAAVLTLKRRRRIRRAGWWECYCLAHDRLGDIADHGDAVVIDDRTEDFDSPDDWKRWNARRGVLASA
jgi:hypothetical protein